MPLAARLRDDAAALQDDLVRLRRDIHRHPEVGLDLPRTQRAVLDELAGLGLEVTPGRTLSSVTAVLRGGRPSAAMPGGEPAPAVLLRADMDALPITETTGLDYASQVDGAMHACGHDTRRCWSVRPGCSARTVTRWPATSCSCSSPARRAGTAPPA